MNAGRRERWAEVERLLDQLLDTEPEARPSLLDRIRSDDAEIAAEVDRLLAAMAKGDDFLQESGPAYAAPLITRMLELNDLAPGTVLGGYEIIDELGRGGMATVYLARDLKRQRAVAVKVLRQGLAATIGSERFLREIAMAARLSHPHILALHDSGEAGGHLYYVMPYVEGESLRQKLEREGQLPLAEALAVTRAVASALTYAHQHRIVHRDIKPENILLVRNSQGVPVHPVVADFGIARALDAAGGERLTETGLALGTPAYMSPEQASSDRHLDARTDIYSLGCVAYEMLAGSPPFTGPSPQAILARHAVDPVPPLRTVRSTIPAPVEAAIERALAKVPADRFSSAEEFARALEAKSIRWIPRWRAAFGWQRVVPALAVAAVIGVGFRFFGNLAGPAVLPSASRIAVLPLLSLSSDTALAQLGRDLATTISANLNGVGGIETADRLTITTSIAGEELSPRDGAALARRLGATSVVHGTLIGAGDKVRVDLGLYGSERLEPLGRGVSVTAHRDSIRMLTDSASLGLLRQVWQRGEPPSPSLAAVTTRSLPALRSFLDGEREMEKDRLAAAALAYRSALNADSTFWLAYFRYAEARSWHEEEIEPEILQTLESQRHIFPARERLMVDAWSEESLARAMELYREATQRFPDYWPGWFHFGDYLYHFGPLWGYDWRHAQKALWRAVELNPRFKPAFHHLFWNSVGKDRTESARALARFRALPGSDLLSRHAEDNATMQHMRLLVALDGSPNATSPEVSALADSAARFFHSQQASQRATDTWPVSFLWAWNPRGQIEFNRRLLQYETNKASRAAILRGSTWAWAERGAWDSALSSIHEAVENEPNPAAFHQYFLAVLGAWLGTVSPQEAIQRRSKATAMLQRLEDAERKTELRGAIAWLDGIVAFVGRDWNELQRAREDTRRSGHPDADIIDQSLAAFSRALRGERHAAALDLVKLDSSCATNVWARCGEGVTPNIAAHRLAAATWLLEAGDTAQAAKLLIWHEARYFSWAWSFVTRPLGYLMLARIEEARGEAISARTHYQQFLRHYDLPMPAQRHLVDEAQAALARLSGAEPAASP